MFREERCNEIVDLLKKSGFVRVETLAEKLHYSPATIRRDLVYLKSIGMIEKTYGGAALADINKRHVLPYDLRKEKMQAEKKYIDRLAAELIGDNQVVFIDGSTTAAGMIDCLASQKNLTVVTINLENCLKLQQRGIRGFCTGGEISPSSPSLSGRIACETLSQLNFDIMFFASKSISLDGMISDYSEKLVDMLKIAIRQSSKVVYLADSSKIGGSSMFNLCSLRDVDTVICEKNLSKQFSKSFPEVTFLS